MSRILPSAPVSRACARASSSRHPLRRLGLAALAGVAQGLRQAARADLRRGLAFQRTLGRLTDEVFGRPIVISAEPSRFMVAEQAKEVGVEIEIALEPEGRDTLAAVTLAACLAARRDPSAIVMLMPSDHLIPDAAGLRAARRRRRRGWRRRGGS